MEQMSDNSRTGRQDRALQKTSEYPVAFPMDLPQQEEEGGHIRDYLHILLRRKWTALTILLIVVTTVSIAQYLAIPVYRATATIKIERQNPLVFKLKEGYLEQAEDNFYDTQYKILKSRTLAKRIIEKMKLDQDPEFSPRKDPLADLGAPASGPASADISKEPGSDTIDRFLGSVSVQPVKYTQLVNISFDSLRPELAAKMANAIAGFYIDYTIESRIGTTQQAKDWLEKQLEDLKRKLEESEKLLNRYASEKRIIYVSDTATDKSADRQNFVTQRIAEFSTELTNASADRIAKESLYKDVQSGDKDSVSSVLNNQLIVSLKQEHAKLDADYMQQLKIYKPDYPKMVKMREQLSSLKERIEAESQKIVTSLRKDYETAVIRENHIKTALEKEKTEAMKFNEKMVEYQILQREAQTNRELYNSLLQRLKETDISATLTSVSNIQVLDRAEVPKSPFKPNKRKNVLMAVLIGLIGGIGMAFFVDYLDNTVKNPQDIEKGLALPNLGIVPTFDRERDPKGLLTHVDKKSPLSEAYRSIGTYIQFSSAARPPKTILITSARQGEGKTTTALNTAITMAHSLGKGVIVDADLRRPALYKILGLDNSNGLTNFLTGNIDIDNPLFIQETKIPNLDAIASGIIPPNPSELLSSYRMRDLLNALHSLYSFVILDSPPILGLSDSLVLSTLTDGVIMVVRAGETPRESVLQGKKVLRGINAKLLGIVLNGVREHDLKYGYYSHYYTYYRDGYGEGEKRKAQKKA